MRKTVSFLLPYSHFPLFVLSQWHQIMLLSLSPGKCQCVINRVELPEINARWNGCSGVPLAILIKLWPNEPIWALKRWFSEGHNPQGCSHCADCLQNILFCCRLWCKFHFCHWSVFAHQTAFLGNNIFRHCFLTDFQALSMVLGFHSKRIPHPPAFFAIHE